MNEIYLTPQRHAKVAKKAKEMQYLQTTPVSFSSLLPPYYAISKIDIPEHAP
jgi:hypothetical protein